MLDWINSNIGFFWMALGFFLLAIEIVAFGLASGVLLFGSIGALITGIAVWVGVIDISWLSSLAVFAIATAVSTLVLWRPLKKLQDGAELGHNRSSDLIGRSFRLESDIAYGSAGETRYSGVAWRVELSEASEVDNLKEGTLVSVEAANAGVFYVVAKSS